MFKDVLSAVSAVTVSRGFSVCLVFFSLFSVLSFMVNFASLLMTLSIKQKYCTRFDLVL